MPWPNDRQDRKRAGNRARHPPLSPATVQRAEAGDAAARFALAEHDLAMAGDEPMRRRPRASARRGHPLAQTSLGVLDLAGDGVPLDRVEAHAGFALAAGQGEREALESAGTLRMELDEEALQRTRALAHQYARQPPRRAPVPLR